MTTRGVYESGFDEENGKHVDADACPECGDELITDGGEIRCVGCGLIVNEYRIDHGPEWRPLDGDRRERTGAPLTPSRHDRGLSTEIGFGSDGKGNSIPNSKRRWLNRLRTQHSRAKMGTKGERNLAHGFTEIARIAGQLDLPEAIRDRASTLFRRAQNENLLLGRSIEAMATASVYAACRCEGVLRTIEEIDAGSRCDRSGLLNAYRVLNVELGLEAKPPRVPDYVARFTSTCDVPDRVRERALELGTAAAEANLANGRNPAGVAAACVYAAAKDAVYPLTQAEVAEVANVTPVTLRNRYHELVEVAD